MRQPVLFADAVGEQIRAGHKLFLEIGAHPILRNDLAECLKENGASGTVLSSLRRHVPERATLLGTAGQLYILGSDLTAADIQLSFVGELAAARFGISAYPNLAAWVKRFQARPAYKTALARGGAYSFAS